MLYPLKFLPHVIVVKCQPCLCYSTFLKRQACLLEGLSREPDEAGPGRKHANNTFSSYSTEDHARIERHAAEHKPTKASQHFTIPESTARLLKKRYWAKLHDQR